MAARTGMANLITRLRALSNAGTADYTTAGETYFTDNHLQEMLDSNVMRLEDYGLSWVKDTVGGGTVEWHRCQAGQYRDYEETTSGTAQWVIRDGPGAVQGTAGYTVNYQDGVINFAADQGGTAYYLTARSYDLHSAAADVWLRRQAYYSDWYEASSDQQRVSRQQAFDHAVKMEAQMRSRGGQNKGAGALQSGEFLRSDVNRSDR